MQNTINPVMLDLFGADAGGGSVPTVSVAAEGVPDGGTDLPTGTGETAAQQAEAAPARDLDGEFQSLIKGEFKDQWQKSVDGIINRRFKEQRSEQERAAAIMEKVVAPMLDRYGMTELDIEKLGDAIRKDDDLIRAQADAANVDVDTFREMRNMRLQIRAQEDASRRAREEQTRRAELVAWMKDGEAVKAAYADFDLREFLSDGANIRLLRSGIPMKQAYEVQNFDRIKEQVRSQTESAVVERIRAKGNRPTENSTSQNNGVAVGTDIMNMPKAEFDALFDRARRGEKISLP